MRTTSWSLVFYSSATFMALNYLMIFTYKEVESGADKKKSAGRVFVDTFKNILDLRLATVILLFSGFWMMLYQLWDLMPNFYADWVSSTPFVEANAWLPKQWLVADPRGIQLKQEVALNLNATMVVCFVIAISYLVARLRVMTAIAIGVTIATLGTVVFGTSPSVYVLFFGIVLFSLGEMLTGPKKTEYFSLIAPKGKKALYLGYVNIPVALGQALGAKLAGWQYGRNGEKATLSLKYLAEKTDHHGARRLGRRHRPSRRVRRREANRRLRDAHQRARRGRERRERGALVDLQAVSGLVLVLGGGLRVARGHPDLLAGEQALEGPRRLSDLRERAPSCVGHGRRGHHQEDGESSLWSV